MNDDLNTFITAQKFEILNMTTFQFFISVGVNDFAFIG